jgi:hypothetical protein
MPIFVSQSNDPIRFFGRHFMFVPIETPSQRFGGLIILSGVATINFVGDSPTDWRIDRVILDLDEDFGRAIHSAPYPPPPFPEQFRFSIAQAVPFATVNARGARLSPQPADARDGSAVLDFSSGPGGAMIQIEVAVINPQSVLIRLGYHLSLYGHLEASGLVAEERSTAQAHAPAKRE